MRTIALTLFSHIWRNTSGTFQLDTASAMPYKPNEIEAKLQDKFGFTKAGTHSSDHRWYELKLPGLPTVLTKVSHSREPISAKIESKMARQLRVRHPFFKGMMDCNQSNDDYRRQVREDPYPPFDVIIIS